MLEHNVTPIYIYTREIPGSGIYFKRVIFCGKWQHIKLKDTKKHPPWSADYNAMWFISVMLVVLANTPDNQKPTSEILY